MLSPSAKSVTALTHSKKQWKIYPEEKDFHLVKIFLFPPPLNSRWYFSFLLLCLTLLTVVTSIRVVSHGQRVSLCLGISFDVEGPLKMH